jgi:hypothetical protein
MNTRLTALIAFALASFGVSSLAAAVPSQGTWEHSLQARDLDGDTGNGPEAFYDTALNITWLASSAGPMTWATAKSWSINLNVNGVTGWRLPETRIPDSTCTMSYATPAVYSQGYGVGCTGSEMGHLFNVTFGNAPDAAVTNTGNFRNMQNYYYWSATPLDSDSYYVWTYQTSINGQAYTGTGTNAFFALAVRDGDVLAPVPEPQTYALMVVGLGLIAGIARRRIQ